jgi:hypothetical protein
MRTRHHYIPIVEAKDGMVLGAPANAVSGGSVGFSLPAGHALTEENLNQLLAHRVEFIFVLMPDTRSDEQVAIDAAMAARRIIKIFEAADFSDANTAALFDQVLGYRSA